jgi:hypothetical protein
MMEDNSQDDKVQPKNNIAGESKNNPFPEIKILGINLVVLIIYTVLCKMGNGLENLILEAFFIGLQVLVCIVAASAKKSGIWLLSALLVLVIGFSTCIGIQGMH